MGCTYKYYIFKVQRNFWSKEAAMLNESPDLSLDPAYRGRVEYIRDTVQDCSLRLSNVTEQDQRKYYPMFINTFELRLRGRDGVTLSVTGKLYEPDEHITGYFICWCTEFLTQ